jgi:NitT/TauT family transport system substrate-binding protein
MSDAPGDLALVVLKDGPIKSIADLKGQKVSMSTRGSLTEWAGRELSKQQGWGPTGMELIPLGAFSAQTAALTTHQIAGMVVEATTAARLEDNGTGRTLLHFDKVVPNFHIHTFWASNDFIANHPDDIKAFMAGWFESLDYMKAHRDESVEISAQILDLPPKVAGSLYDYLMPFYNETGKYNPQALDTIVQSMVDSNLIPKAVDLKPFYTEEFLPKRN